MWSPDYDIIVETLTGSEFTVTVLPTDTIGYLKYRIKKYEGIPVSQQHILFNQAELKDATVLKDVPLVRGSRLTLVLGMRGGPISARRVVADCDNWYDLSDVLNGSNSSRSQLTPIEPLTISTTGVKVLLYKDCKKNINRLMKLRKHHLHSHGAGTSTASGMMSGSMKCSAAGASSARSQLKFLDKHVVPPGEEHSTGAVDALDQQWLLDNITTLKKMKQLRQSLEAKKKKKPRSGDPSDYYQEFSVELREVQPDQEMHEKLQRWLHRVASNATHLSDGETVPHPQPLHSLATSVACSSPTPSSTMNLFDRVRRKSATGSAAGEEGFLHPFSRAASVGGARKKDSFPSANFGGATAMMSSSRYSMPMEDFCLIAKDYERAVRDKVNQLAEATIVGAGGGGAEDRFTRTRLTEEEIDARLHAANSSDTELDDVQERESSQFEERLLTQFYDNTSPHCENLFRAFATNDRSVLKGGGPAAAVGGMPVAGADPVSQFRWRFHSDGSVPKMQPSPQQREASDAFLSSLLSKRDSGTNETTQRREQEEKEVEEVATVIIEKADAESGEELLLEAACCEILNDPDAFEEDEDAQLEQVHNKRYELIDLLGHESSGDSDSGASFAMLKNDGYFDLGEDAEGESDASGAEDNDDGPVLLYENEDTGSATFLGGSKTTFWPNFDDDCDEETDHGADGATALPTPTSAVRECATDEDDNLVGSEAEGLEFDDFTYFPARSSAALQETNFKKQSSSLPPPPFHSVDKTAFLHRRQPVSGEPVGAKKKDQYHYADDRQLGPSLPEIINRGAHLRRQQAQVECPSFDTLENVAPGAKRERNSKVQLPDIKLLESDLKMMGLDMILDDSDDSFERTIKRHFRSESKSTTVKPFAQGECLLRSGNEELKPVRSDSDWLIQFDMAAARAADLQPAAQGAQKGNRCAKCNKKLGIIMIMKCHCGLIFCAQHRYAEAHDCAYDFKEEGKRILAKENPLVVGEKLPKI